MNNENNGRGGPLDLLLAFYIYNFIGWMGESTYCSLGDGELVNRGFLVGPQVPLYGSGAMLLYAVIEPIRRRIGKKWYGIALSALVAMIAADALEYLTSLGMEKLFHARWWDYSEKKFNLNGRICLEHTIYWALAGIGSTYILHPATMRFIAKHIPPKVRTGLVAAFSALFLTDTVVTVLGAINIGKLSRKLTEVKTQVSETAEEVRDSAEILITPLRVSAQETLDEAKAQVAEVQSAFFSLIRRDPEKKKRSLVERISARLLRRRPLQKDIQSRVGAAQELISGLLEQIRS